MSHLDPTTEPFPALNVAGPPTPAKAIIAGVTALASGLVIALADAGITATEWVTVVAGTILAVAGVYAVSNEPGKFTLRG